MKVALAPDTWNTLVEKSVFGWDINIPNMQVALQTREPLLTNGDKHLLWPSLSKQNAISAIHFSCLWSEPEQSRNLLISHTLCSYYASVQFNLPCLPCLQDMLSYFLWVLFSLRKKKLRKKKPKQDKQFHFFLKLLISPVIFFDKEAQLRITFWYMVSWW